MLVASAMALFCPAALAQPTGLEAALRATLSQHPALAGKRAEVAAKGFTVEAAQAQRYPSLTGAIATNDNNTQPVTLRARQPLWAFGRIDGNIAYAQADQRTDEADLLRVQRQLIDQTATAYVRVQGARARALVAQDNVAALEKWHQQILRREQGQLASKADVRLALARLTQARAQMSRYAAEVTLAKTDLLALTQTPVSAEAPIPDALTSQASLPSLQALAEEHHADLLWKQEQIKLAQANVIRESTSPMPTVYLQVDRYINQPAYANDNMVVGVVLEGGLDGMGFAARGRGQAATARLQAARQDLETTRSEVLRTLRNLISSRDLQRALMDTQDQSVTELEGLLASYRRQYEAGSKSWLDLLNMQRELTEQRLQQVQAQSDWWVHTLKLAALTGQLDALAFVQD
jgi:adhesin transport system outer membrane protein